MKQYYLFKQWQVVWYGWSQPAWWSGVRRYWCWNVKTLGDMKVSIGSRWWRVHYKCFVNANYSHSTLCRFWNVAVRDTEFRKGSKHQLYFEESRLVCNWDPRSYVFTFSLQKSDLPYWVYPWRRKDFMWPVGRQIHQRAQASRLRYISPHIM